MSETQLGEDSVPPASESPFGSQAIDIQTITLMRIYDVLMGLYREQNHQAATDLLELHLQGVIMTPAPAFIGQFITNDMNLEDDSPTDI